jgi:hypothetical protein
MLRRELFFVNSYSCAVHSEADVNYMPPENVKHSSSFEALKCAVKYMRCRPAGRPLYTTQIIIGLPQSQRDTKSLSIAAALQIAES